MKTRLLLVLILACTGGPALADDTVIQPSRCGDTAIQQIGAVIQPIGEYPSIVMDKMLVTIDFYSDHAEVDSTFTFRNTGSARTVRMGIFETGGGVAVVLGKVRSSPGYSAERQGFTSFQAWVDDEEAPTKIEGFQTRGDPVFQWHRWRVTTATFGAGQTRSVRAEYVADTGRTPCGKRLFLYDVTTGASWKGLIGQAELRLRLHHDPLGGWYEFDTSRFRRTGPASFGWIRSQYEPKGQDYIAVTHHHRGTGIYVGPRHVHRGDPPYPHIKGGRLWAQVRDVADWLGAELRVESDGVTFVRGGSTVNLRAGSSLMTVDSLSVRLPAAPRLKQGHLMVPVAAVMKPFEAVLEFQPGKQTVRIILPIHYDLFRILCEVDGPAALAAIPAGWAPPPVAEYDRQVRLHFLRQPRSRPLWMCTGDFDGDGLPEGALLLWKADLCRLGMLEKIADGEVSFHWLEPAPHPRTTPVITALASHPPGVVAYWQEGQDHTYDKTGRLDLVHQGVKVITWEKAAVMYYWDDEGGRYRKIQTAD